MKKLLIIVLLFISVSFINKSNAQDRFRRFSFNANANFAYPIGEYSDIIEFGYGIHVGGNYFFTKNWEVFLDFGFYQWSFKQSYLKTQFSEYLDFDFQNIEAPTYQAFKIFPGIRYYFLSKKIRPYIEGSFAILFTKFPRTLSIQHNVPNPTNQITLIQDISTKTKTGASIGIGLLIHLNEINSLEFSINYNPIFEGLNQNFRFINENAEFSKSNPSTINNIIFSGGYKIHF
ncbi:MAG: outer membrane beta-barrel protein [Bacteroidales bacterium]